MLGIENTTLLVLDILASLFADNPFNIGSSKSNYLEFCNQYIFCFNRGDLIRRILIQSNETNKQITTPEEVIDQLVRFYSFHMFLIHYHSLQKQKDSMERFKDRFLNTHSHEDLSSYLQVKKTNLIRSTLKMGIKEGDDLKETVSISKSVILTSSQSVLRISKTREFLVSDIEDQGTVAMKASFYEGLMDSNVSTLLVYFDKPSTIKHFGFLQILIGNWINEKKLAKEKMENKHVCFIVYQTSKKNFSDVTFSGTDWNYVVIEDLTGTSYYDNIQRMDLSTFEITQNFQKDQDLVSIAQIYLRTFHAINFKDHLGNFVQDKCIPALKSITSHSHSSDSFFIKFIQDFYQDLIEAEDFKTLPDWKEQIFKQKSRPMGESVSIEKIIQEVSASMLTKYVKGIFVEMKKSHVLGNLFSLDSLDLSLQKQFQQLFKFELDKLKPEIR